MAKGGKGVSRPTYSRDPIGGSERRGERLRPVLGYLENKGMSIAQLAEGCGISRQGMNKRFLRDDCTLSDMERMASAAGARFVWGWEPIEDEENTEEGLQESE